MEQSKLVIAYINFTRSYLKIIVGILLCHCKVNYDNLIGKLGISEDIACLLYQKSNPTIFISYLLIQYIIIMIGAT